MADDDLQLRRGGRLIRVKRHPTRFTVIAPKSAESASALKRLEGAKVLELPASDQLGMAFRGDVTNGDLERVTRQVHMLLPLAVVSPAYVGEEYSAAIFYLTDQIVIELHELDQDELARLLEQYGLTDLGALHGLPPTWRVVRLAPVTDANAIVTSNLLASERLIRTAEPNLIERLYGHRTATRLLPQPVYLLAAGNELSGLWHLTPDEAQTQMEHIDPTSTVDVCPTVWNENEVTGAGTVVSVIDVDFSYDHPDFDGKYTNNPADLPGLQAPTTAFPNHGTCCVGLLAGARNGVGSIGVAPKSQVFAIRLPAPQIGPAGVVKTFCDDVTLGNALKTAAEKAHIASMSLSWPAGTTGPASNVLTAIAAGYNNGDATGCLYFFAVGNEGVPLGVAPPADAPFKIAVVHSDGSTEVQTINYALDDTLLKTPGVVMVGASTSKAKHAHYSNWGDGLGLAAPSGAYIANEPRDDGAQESVSVAVIRDFAEYPFSGTSAATPIAAGVAALVRSADPALSAKEVREILEDTADQIGPAAQPTDANATYSLPGRGQRKRSMYFGYGKVNAKAAVAEALRRLQH
jgi:subtilisin family serine protease